MAKILFLLEDYNHFYTEESKILKQQGIKYQLILKDLIGRKHYQSDGMANAFVRLGHETQISIPEANPIQLQWAKENSPFLYLKWLIQKPIRSFNSRIRKQYRTSYNSIQFQVLMAQVKNFRPDVIYIYSNIFYTEYQVLELKRNCRKVVLQWTCPIWAEQPNFPFWAFDLIITAAIQLKEYFESKKYPCIYIQQAFDTRVLEQLKPKHSAYKGDVIFIGSFSLGHNYRLEVLEFLLKNNIDLTIYGTGTKNLPEDSLVRKTIKEPLYGMDMYNEYRNYKMAIHINTTGVEGDGIDWNRFAGAKRLFEITGSGTLLLTPEQENVKDLFDISKEVVTFKNAEDLLSKINLLLKDTDNIKKIARNGMERTLNEHSFLKRAEQLSLYLFE